MEQSAMRPGLVLYENNFDSSTEQLDRLLSLDESCDYLYKIRIPQQTRRNLAHQLNALGYHESSIYPDMEHIAKEEALYCFNF